MLPSSQTSRRATQRRGGMWHVEGASLQTDATGQRVTDEAPGGVWRSMEGIDGGRGHEMFDEAVT
eukprot:3524123-Prymnesium_polylepis.1